MKNSDFRQFANATQAEPESSGMLRHLLTALVIIVPAAGIYAWKTGMFNKPRYVAVAPQVQSASAPSSSAPSSQAQNSAAPAPQTFASTASSTSTTTAAPQSGSAPDKKRGSSPPDLAKSLNMALKMQMNMGMMFEMVAESMEAFGGGSGREVSSDRIIEYCKVQARRRLEDQGYGRSGRQASESFMFDVMAERVYCVMTRRPDKLCEPPVKGEFLKQFGTYLKIRNGALSELFGVAGAEAGAPLKAGVHRAVNEEFRKLAQRGYFSMDDFGWFPPEDIKMLIGDIKGVKPACKR